MKTLRDALEKNTVDAFENTFVGTLAYILVKTREESVVSTLVKTLPDTPVNSRANSLVNALVNHPIKTVVSTLVNLMEVWEMEGAPRLGAGVGVGMWRCGRWREHPGWVQGWESVC